MCFWMCLKVLLTQQLSPYVNNKDNITKAVTVVCQAFELWNIFRKRKICEAYFMNACLD